MHGMKGREKRPCRLCFVGVYADQALSALTVQEPFLISFVHDSRELRDVSFFFFFASMPELRKGQGIQITISECIQWWEICRKKTKL